MKPLAIIVLLAATSLAQVTIKGIGVCIGTCQLDPPVVTVTTLTLPGGVTGSPYSQTLAATGGKAPYTWALFAGSLPTSLALSGTGVIAGTPSVAGTFTFSVQATDSIGTLSSPRLLSIVITTGATLTINNTSFSNPILNGPYNQPIVVTGGTGAGYVCTVHSGSLPPGVTISSCTLVASSVGGSANASYTFSLHAVDSAANSTNSPNYTVTVVQPSGPPNYAAAGRAVFNDSCILQIPGGGPSTTGCPPTDSVLPNLGSGVSGANTSATDPQFNNIVMTRCTDGSLGGIVTTSPFVNRPYWAGAGSSGDTNGFNTNSSLLTVIDSGNRFIIESYDTTNHLCYPVLTGSGGLYLPGAGEFSSKTASTYFSYFQGSTYQVVADTITCATPGHAAGCTPPSAGTVVADFSKVMPTTTTGGVVPWAATTSYSYGDYVYVYLTNSQNASISAATCASNVITYTIPAGLKTLDAGGLMTVTGLSTFNGVALPITTANAAGTTITSNTTCTNGTATGTGTVTEGSDVLFQDVDPGTHTSGSGPTWNAATGTRVTDGASLVWIAVGTTNFQQGGGWTTIGGTSVDETQFSGGFSNNNFDTTAKGALNVTMNGNQNTGFLVYTYDSTAKVYYEWNTMSAVAKSFTCGGGGTGPTCAGGSYTIAVLGEINPSSTTQCNNSLPFSAVACQFYLHNVKTFKGGAWNEITPEFCSSTSFGPGNCPQTSKYFWSKGTIMVNMALLQNSGHETERFTYNVNIPNAGSTIAVIRAASNANIVSPVWTNSNINQFDAHWGWYFLNGSTDDTTITPFAGTNFNYSDFPYTSPFRDEILIVPTCGTSGSVLTPACSASELQNVTCTGVGTPNAACTGAGVLLSQVAREGHCFTTGTSNFFNPANCIGVWSQDGTQYAASTDYACSFGATTGGTLLCGFPWSPSYAYLNNVMISPTATVASKQTNAGGFVYQNQSGSTCVSGASSPAPFYQALPMAFTVTSVAAHSGSSTTYTGTFTSGGSNAFAGYTLTMAAFSHGANNGSFLVTASTTTTVTVTNASGVVDTTGTATGPNTPDGACNWINLGVNNQRGDVVIYQLQ